MTSKEILKKEIDYLDDRQRHAYQNNYYLIYQETQERIKNLNKVLEDLKRLEELEKENQDLKDNETISALWNESYKYKKVIKYLKEGLEIFFTEYEGRIVLNYDDFYSLTQEQLKLLKEVLEWGDGK